MMERDYAVARQEAAVGSFTAKVFGWMTAALMITAVVAMTAAVTPAIRNLVFASPGVFIGLVIGELVLVMALSATVHRLSAPVATSMFVAYSALNGLTLAVIFLVYDLGSVATTFFVTAGTFGVMAAYGYTTRRDLTGIGSLCVMALLGLIIASIVNLLLANSALYWLITYAGIVIFVGLTAYDAQKIRVYAAAGFEDAAVAQKAAIMAALALYLDFINLFLLLLRLLGKRR